MAKNIVLLLFICIFMGRSNVYSQPTAAEVDRATREVDRSMADEAEKQMRTFPKKPKITIEGERGEEEELEDPGRSDSPRDKKLIVGGCSGVSVK